MTKARQTLDDWRALVARETRGGSEDGLAAETPEGIRVKALYTEEDLDDLVHLGTLPGLPPFVRGPRATMYAGRPWTIRQYAGYSTAEESNAFYRRNLEAGQMGLSVAFDLATHRGYDSDHERVEGDVGKAGVAIDSVEDMKILFDGIPLDRMSVSMTMNGAVLPVFAMYAVAARSRGWRRPTSPAPCRTTSSRSSWSATPISIPRRPRCGSCRTSSATPRSEMPRFNPISISGYHMLEAGATSVQELAFTLADGVEYVRAALESGLDVDRFAPRLSFFFGIGMDFFMEVAKLRAARWLWATLMEEKFAPKDPRSLMLRTHCQTSGASLTSLDPYNNVVRTTIEALAAVLGGTQSLHTNAFDEALALPSEFSARIARNTQLVLQHETGVTRVVDPLAGSYYVESLTASLAARARELIDEVEALGGMTRAVESGMPKLRIEEAAARRQARVDRGEETVVGVNRFRADREDEVELLAIDNTSVRDAQVRRLADVRGRRDDLACRRALAALTVSAESGDGNLLALGIDAARARATVGEITDALEKVWGRHRAEVRSIAGVYGAHYAGDEEFGRIRAEVDAFAAAEGRRPRLLVAKLGQDGHDRGAKVIATAFADIGFDVDIGPLFQTPAEAARQAVENDVHVVGISTQAAGHRTLVPRFLDDLRAAGADDVVVVCGGVIPAADHDELRRAGVAAIYGPGTSIPAAAREVLDLVRGRRLAA